MIKPSTSLVPLRRRPMPTAPHQLNMLFDAPNLRGMLPSERSKVIGGLARLLIEAAGVARDEEHDDDER